MTRLRINPEFLRRHLFALVVMLGIGGWFAYDGLVVYPRTDAAALYESIEGTKPPESMPRTLLEAFKRRKIQAQYGFAVLAVLAGLAIGAHLLSVAGFRLELGEEDFVYGGRRYRYDEVKGMEDSKWRSSGRAKVTLGDGRSFMLDAWHHSGAEELHRRILGIVSGTQK